LDQSLQDSLLFAQRGKRRERDMDGLLKTHRVHDLVTLGHDQRCATALIHAAKPPGIKIRLIQVLFARLGVLADLHRHATPRARITLAGNNNSAISISLFRAQILTPVLHGMISERARQIFADVHKLAPPAMGSGSDLSVNYCTFPAGSTARASWQNWCAARIPAMWSEQYG
jgi:hypothetical protein